MGVKHGREYEEIIDELSVAIGSISDAYLFFEMEPADWDELDEEQRKGLMEVLADDVFYALGEETAIAVGSGTVTYRPKHHCIEVSVDHIESRLVRLI
ncbi:hypothetical protein ACFPYJ_02440 [Paenibacillus solisilvae]|uniref:Uncharacterized protein n=1 Tax=Paenibacillus solisilvae TaxID=2486751 RepID=A0ABW0VR93_9BACL